jgi:hypothetical protein
LLRCKAIKSSFRSDQLIECGGAIEHRVNDAVLLVPVGTAENSPAFQGWVCV